MQNPKCKRQNETRWLGTVEEPAKRVPVLYDVDVAIAGSGTAAVIAAIAAGRYGAKTVVIDRFGQVGGNIGPGMWSGGSLHLALINQGDPDHEELLNRKGMGGIPEEFHRRVILGRPNADAIADEVRRELEAKHLNVAGYQAGAGGGLPGYFVDSHVCSHVALEMMEEAGVELVLSAYAADPIMDGNRVTGLFVETKSGRVAVKAKVVIDGTGQAEVAMRAGAPVRKVKAPNLGLWYAMGGVDWEQYQRFADANAEASEEDLAWSRENLAASRTEADPFPDMHHMLPYLRKAWEAGEFEFRRKVGEGSIHIGLGNLGDGMAGGRTGTAGAFDFSETQVVTQMELEHREHCYRFARFLRTYIPGFENVYLMVCSPFLGARGGRSIDAVYPISMEDLEAERQFDDVIYIYNDRRSQKNCDVPYRALVPREIDGLLATGRSAMPYGPNFRARCNMLLNGQAAGVAAALCVRDEIQPRDLDARRLQKILVQELDCPLAEEERLGEMGLKSGEM